MAPVEKYYTIIEHGLNFVILHKDNRAVEELNLRGLGKTLKKHPLHEREVWQKQNMKMLQRG